MQYLRTGQFYGQTNETIRLDGLTLTDTEYTHERVDWHYHENAYFTFILDGKVLEGNKKEIYTCKSGSLLFHNWQEAHYNIKPEGFTRGFQIELLPHWFESFEINSSLIRGHINLSDPMMKVLMYNIFKETKLGEENVNLAINALLIELFSLMTGNSESPILKKPAWTGKITELLHDSTENWNLRDLSNQLGIHPVHLSRNFTKYFNCNLGEYIRTLKIQRALSLLPEKDLSLTEIAFRCGFADQSHFIRAFKEMHTISPLQYKKLMLKK